MVSFNLSTKFEGSLLMNLYENQYHYSNIQTRLLSQGMPR